VANSVTDVIVTNIERPIETLQTIEALLKANDDIRIILVNNGSIVKPDIKANDKVTIINLGSNIGQAKAVNIGLKLTTSEYVCFMHNDIVINDKNWISRSVNFLKENPGAGLVDVYGWKMIDGKVRRITSLKGHEVQNVMTPEQDFTEVARTDEMANIFINDGLKADERYGRTCCGVWIDVLGRRQKLYVIKLEDAVHSIKSEQLTENKLTPQEFNKSYEVEKKLRKDVRLAKLAEYGLSEYKIYE